MPAEVQAFAPGRVNLIGEHTDYNEGLALPFAIAEGVTVRARAASGPLRAVALDIGERDEFDVEKPPPAEGWRAFARGIAAELRAAGFAVSGAELEIHGDVPRGAGLSSSAALEVSLALALLALADAELDRVELARLCSRVENEWVGAHTGLLDQLASLFGEPDAALEIDFASLQVTPVPLVLDSGWRIVTLDSGEAHTLAASGYNARRSECARACELLDVRSLRELEGSEEARLGSLPDDLARRVRHVLGENARVRETVTALRARDLPRVGVLLDASHASLRDLYECSTGAIEAAVERLREAGAVGARLVGGGFGGSVLGLFGPGSQPPVGAREVRPSRGAHVIDTRV